jgi:hypothetical protein
LYSRISARDVSSDILLRMASRTSRIAAATDGAFHVGGLPIERTGTSGSIDSSEGCARAAVVHSTQIGARKRTGRHLVGLSI